MIEITILTPRAPTETKEPVENSPMLETATQEPVQHQLEILQYENYLIKEDARPLREELERWKEASKRKTTRGLDTLVEAALQFEDPLSIQEKEELICHECGVLLSHP